MAQAKNADEQAAADKAKADKVDPQDGADQAAEQVETAVAQEQEQGFRGVEVDQTPNEAYTVTGDHASTPEAQADPVAARHEATNPELR
jgi:hypothetical protein